MKPVAVLVVAFLSMNLEASDARGADQPRVWAVVVGINKPDDIQIPRCKNATRDAQAVADWVIDTAGWGDLAVLKLDDFGKRNHGIPADNAPTLLPTRANLEWALTGWLAHRVRDDDVVLIYYAGQAVARAPRPGSTTGRAYLLPSDARLSEVDQTAWALDDAIDRSGLAKKARVVVWLDTSLRGRGEVGSAPEKGSPSGSDWVRSLSRAQGVTAWLAADGRPNPEDGEFLRAIKAGLGTSQKAHNLMGCLASLQADPKLVSRGFRTSGGVGPVASLWSGGVKLVEQVVPELIVQSGHGDRVTSVLMTADNATVLTASQDSTVRIWKLNDQEPAMIRVLTDPFIGVRVLAMDPDGQLLVAGDGAGGIVGWDMKLDRPKPMYGPPRHQDAVGTIAFLPESLRFASLDQSGRSILWDATGGVIREVGSFSSEPLTRLVAADRPVAGVASMVGVFEGSDGQADSLRTFGPDGKPLVPIEGPGGRVTAIDLSRDGRTLAVGNDRGRVVLLDLPSKATRFDRTYSGSIHRVGLARSGLLVIADRGTLRLVDPRVGGGERELTDAQGQAAPGRVDRAVFSDDGRWLAACTSVAGRTLVWRVEDPARPVPVAVPEDDAQGLSPAFSPDSKTLLVGDADGGLRTFGLDEAPTLRPRTRIKASRGQVAWLRPSSSGRFLLEITKDDLALVWDLEQGRGCQPLPGRWTSGDFLPDETKLMLSRRPDEGGQVVLFDRSLNAPTDRVFGFNDPVGKPRVASFDRVVVSRSGKWVAAASDVSQLPLACVWEVATGQLVHTTRVHDGGLTALDISGDDTYLLTASEDATTSLWPMADPSVEFRRSSVNIFSPDTESPAFTAAKVCPTNPQRVAAGTRGGTVSVWDWTRGKPKPERLGDPFVLTGEVTGLAFSTDGRWLAASARREKTIRFWDLSGPGRPRSVDFTPRVHHTEQVGALAGWPGGSMILSGGDDNAVRFWSLKDHSLIGTLFVQSRTAREGVLIGKDQHPLSVDWLAISPEGLFDGSLRGESMVKWRVGDSIVTLGQAEETHHVFQLAESFARGEKPKAPAIKVEAPGLKIFDPPAERTSETREVALTLWFNQPGITGLRLYQNDVPVRGEGDFLPGETPNFARTKISLRKGENRLYAMAARPGAVDWRSEDLTLRYEGPEPEGRLHTLALGISDYPGRPLKYAHIDAQGISDYLKRQGVRGASQPGIQTVLLNEEATPERIDNALLQIRDAVQGHPEDTVVLFLAGHTDTDEAANQFCLLLPKFPFGDPLPIGDVAVRGNTGGIVGRAKVGQPQVLPYSLIYLRLAKLEALQRLVIVDACQAGAILEDKAVSNIQKFVERGSRKARNSYLLAARRGEPASEVDALQHGLLTYALLQGMGATGLKPVPSQLGGFPGRTSADLNRDGLVSSDELVAYADETLPRLARMFPQIVLRSGGDLVSTGPDRDQKLRVQSGESSFPLITHPAGR